MIAPTIDLFGIENRPTTKHPIFQIGKRIAGVELIYLGLLHAFHILPDLSINLASPALDLAVGTSPLLIPTAQYIKDAFLQPMPAVDQLVSHQ